MFASVIAIVVVFVFVFAAAVILFAFDLVIIFVIIALVVIHLNLPSHRRLERIAHRVICICDARKVGGVTSVTVILAIYIIT